MKDRADKGIAVAATVDALGLFCPLPILRTERKLRKLRAGEVVQVISDDPSFVKDMTGWCRRSGNELVKMDQRKESYFAYVRKRR